MRIALLSAEYPPQPGGVGDYTRRLGEALVDRGHKVSIFTILDFGFWILDLDRNNSNPKSKIGYPVGVNPKSDWGWGCWRDAIMALDQTRPDVLHIQYQTGAYGMHPAINFLPWRLRRLPRRPAIVVTAHDLLVPYLFPKAGPLRTWVTYRLLADADAVVMTNEADWAQVAGGRSQGGWGIHKAALIPIGSNIAVAPPAGYDRAAWRARLQIEPSETLIAYFGLISRTKGLDVLLDALARLPAHFRLLVVGGAATTPEDRAYAASIDRRLAQQGPARRVTITGHCAEAEVSAHLLAADMAALPFVDGASFRRGSLLAALAHGLPTVTTFSTSDERRSTTGGEPIIQNPKSKIGYPVGVNPKSKTGGRLEDGENVLLTPPGDARALATAIERLAGDAGLRARLAAAGQALAAQFGWAEIAARHEELYARCAIKRKA